MAPLTTIVRPASTTAPFTDTLVFGDDDDEPAAGGTKMALPNLPEWQEREKLSLEKDKVTVIVRLTVTGKDGKQYNQVLMYNRTE